MADERITALPAAAAPSASDAEWHVIHGGKEFGPMSLAELVEKAVAGKIEADDLVGKTGGLWTKASDLDFLQKQFLLQDSREKANREALDKLGIWLSQGALAAIGGGVLLCLVAFAATWASRKPTNTAQPVLIAKKESEDIVKRGWAWSKKKDYDKAIQDYDEAIRLDPKLAHAYFFRGYAWSKKKDYHRAIQDFDEVIRLNPNYALAYFERGYAWYEKKEYDKAISDNDEAIHLDPKLALAYHNRGRAWSKKKDYDMAIQDFDEAIRLDPKSTNAYFLRGYAWSKKKDYDKAIKNYDEVIRLNPNYALAFNNRGRAWYEKKDYDKAIRDYDEAIRLDPNSALAYNNLAWLLATCPDQKVRDGKRAIEMATKACELRDWKRGFELDTLAAAYAEAGQFDEAERYQRKALEDPAYHGSAGDELRERLELYKQKRPARKNP